MLAQSTTNNSDLLRLRFINTICYHASQLALSFPLRDEEMLPQRLRAEGAFSVYQSSPEDGGIHHSLQCDAEVRC